MRDARVADQPPWESCALFLPPGAGERPLTAVVRGPAEPVALSERQQAIYDALTEAPVRVRRLGVAAFGVEPGRASCPSLIRELSTFDSRC